MKWAQIVVNAGIAKSTVSQLMSFDGLPHEALQVLAVRPEMRGATSSEDIVKLCAKGRVAALVTALERLGCCKVDLGEAVRFTNIGDVIPPKREAIRTTKIMSDKKHFFRYVACR